MYRLMVMIIYTDVPQQARRRSDQQYTGEEREQEDGGKVIAFVSASLPLT